MEDAGSSRVRGISRRGVLRNGLLAGFGITVATGVSAVVTGTARADAAQANWRWCSRCSGLFYGPNQSTSVCPGAAHHEFGSNWNYIVLYDEPAGTTNPQPNWFWCGQCQGLFNAAAGLTFGGICPTAGHPEHRAGRGSYSYSVKYSDPSLGQPGWTYCSACYVLFYMPGSYLWYGECPNGGPHNGTVSYYYDLAYTT